jgi:hypothetical protein
MEEEINEEKGKDKKGKSRNKELLRNFIGEDSKFLETSDTMHALFVEQLAEFSAFDPTLNAAFGNTWLLQIKQCRSMNSDHLKRSELLQKTTEQQKELAECLQLTNDLEYFVQKAFPQSTALWSEFGFKQRSRISKRASDTVFWLHTMHRVALDYETELLAAGMPATFLSQLDTKTTAMANAEREQEYAKRLRLRETRLRIMHLNRLHGYMQTVQRAAAVVYRNNAARYHQFNP